MSVDSPHTSLADIPTQTLYGLLEPVTIPSESPRASFINWGLSYECTPLAVFEPETEYQCELVLELARREGRTVRAVGVGHSPSDLACTSQFMLRTEKLNKIIEVSVNSRVISIPISIAPCIVMLEISVPRSQQWGRARSPLAALSNYRHLPDARDLAQPISKFKLPATRAF